ncbi:MAG: DUF5666 domain-containing protein [Nitrospira sp.]|nr:DUF5666 domain-containing protein [Nitrospira sp.]
MKRTLNMVYFVGAIGLVGMLWGCGSGGGNGAPAASGTGSANGTAAASGTVTGFGSVYVNGKKFETSGASFIVDGQSGSQSDLKLGMTVAVIGSVTGDQRSAVSVRQRDAVEGLVQSVAVDGLSLVVMGQTVLIDNTTLIDNSIPAQSVRNLVVGTDFVEVNGHIRPNGVIQATFIEKKPAGTVTPEVRGFVKSHNEGARTFQIGNLTVIYTAALINDMPNPAGNAWNGLLVEAKGTGAGSFNPTTTTLTASKVEPENQGVQQADEFEVEGFVMQVLGPGDFFIGSTRVQTTLNTVFRGGTIDEIIVGAKLSAEGRLANGIVTAKHVKFHEGVRLEGNIASINTGTGTINVTGLSGVTVTVDSQTEVKTDTGASLNDLSVGDHVRVRGRLNGTTGMIATRVEQRSATDDVDLQGPVWAVSNPNLTILGVSVNTSGISEDEFKGLNDQPIGRAAFFNAVKVSTLVKVKGRIVGGVVAWREAELED